MYLLCIFKPGKLMDGLRILLSVEVDNSSLLLNRLNGLCRY